MVAPEAPQRASPAPRGDYSPFSETLTPRAEFVVSTGTGHDRCSTRAGGNLVGSNGPGCGAPGAALPANPCYEYDALGAMTRAGNGSAGTDWRYIYTADDERFWAYSVNDGKSIWTLRDLGGKVLREYDAHISWTTFKDYIYRDGQLLASSHTSEGVQHFHLDHLGTPRLVTGVANAAAVGFYTVEPCRAYDSRTLAAPLNAASTRVVALAGVCGIPSEASAVSLNITVVDATANGEMVAYPSNVPRPNSSAISHLAGVTRANNGVLKLGSGALALFNNQPSGSAHLVIDVNGYFIEAGMTAIHHAYFPFGEELTPIAQDAEQMKFTGHERDLGVAGNAADDLDYMHARLHNPQTGRFLSVDPVLNVKRAMKRPQAWNRYAYVTGNPMKYVDPKGLAAVLSACNTNSKTADKGICDHQKSVLQQAFGDSYRFLSVGADGSVSISSRLFASRGTLEAGFAKLVGSEHTFTLFTGANDFTRKGGGAYTDTLDQGGANIYIDTAVFPKMTGDVMGTVATAFVHETGHGVGWEFRMFYERINADLARTPQTIEYHEGYAVEFENRYRRSHSLDFRASYSGLSADIFQDADVTLFPPD
jgi:RHS repeat-associated protein